jgi:signal transduction histidine kinase
VVWEALFAVVTVASAAIALVSEDGASPRWRLGVVGVCAGLLAWYVGVGRPAVHGHTSRRRETVAVAGLVVLFALGLWLTPTLTYLLVGLPAIVHMLLPERTAYVTVAVLCLLPPIIFQVRTGDTHTTLTAIAPVGLIAMLFSFLTTIAIIRTQRRSTERAALVAELQESRAAVAQLSMQAGVQAERQRLAGDIHDTVAQGLSSVVMLLEAARADPAHADDHLDLALRSARENLFEVRAIVAALTPPQLDGSTLGEALGRVALRWQESTGVPVEVQIVGDPRPASTDVEVVLLRAAQEALANIGRHAGARAASLILGYGDGALSLQVHDDGRGIDQTRPEASGYGLATMRARVDQLGGQLSVHSGQLSGTYVEIEVPA